MHLWIEENTNFTDRFSSVSDGIFPLMVCFNSSLKGGCELMPAPNRCFSKGSLNKRATKGLQLLENVLVENPANQLLDKIWIA